MDTAALLAAASNGGLVAIVALALLEKLIPVLPSYVLLIGIGMVAVSGAEMLGPVIAAATLGSTLGGLIWYGLGRSLGAGRVEELVGRWGRWIFLSPALYRRLTDSFRRFQFRIVLIGQTIPTVRIYLALPAGVLALPMRSFIAATFIGTIFWNAPLITVGWLLRNSGRDPVSVGFVVLAIIVAVEAAFLIVVRVRHVWRPRP